MLDQNWDLKIIDFGLAAPTQGRDGSGLLKTTLGTFGYMAPEQHLGREYQGEKVDIFALAVILFVMISKHAPFNAAIPKDQLYVSLASKNYEHFWNKHSRHKGDEFFSKNFKNLFEKMTELDPDLRLSLDEIKNHPWYLEKCNLTQKDISDIFEARFERLNAKLKE